AGEGSIGVAIADAGVSAGTTGSITISGLAGSDAANSAPGIAIDGATTLINSTGANIELIRSRASPANVAGNHVSNGPPPDSGSGRLGITGSSSGTTSNGVTLFGGANLAGGSVVIQGTSGGNGAGVALDDAIVNAGDLTVSSFGGGISQSAT